jgi:tetratricopeptide (TPR) repeat protein
LTKARAYLDEAVALARKLGKRRELAVALNTLAQLHRMEGQLNIAETLYEEVLSLARGLGDQNSVAIALLNLAMVSIDRSRGGRAKQMLIEALAIATQVGLRPVGQSALEVTAGLCAFEGAWDEAARFFGAAEAQAERAGLRRDAVDEAFLAPLIAKAKSALGAKQFQATVNEGQLLPYENALGSARIWLERELEVSD